MVQNNQYQIQIRQWLTDIYGIRASEVSIVVNGVNTVLLVCCPDSKKFYIKIFQQERTQASVESEGRISTLLQSQGLSASKAVLNRDGAFSSVFSSRNSHRPALVFEEAKGRLCQMTEGDLAALATSLAALHRNTSGLPFAKPIIIRDLLIDLEPLIDHPLIGDKDKNQYSYLLSCIKNIRDDHCMTFCHGDPRPNNAFIEGKQAYFIDFESCGIASSFYDCGIISWNIIGLDPESALTQSNINYFIDTYNRNAEKTCSLYDIAPYILLREARSIWFLLANDLVSGPLLARVFQGTTGVIKFTHRYL
ncbi:phosphotransferase [Affinibrenneria salicis]|uniref:Phosphotransferase n=1 Tax=Affinibrenneria salicis TaxID=2590031 RepID=A0A5J5G211_9GAMM|nr:phosphotransferase [Affinibrenneria salicis]KAA9000701.1 phosphotransferase [Affinibrenneria salicis]